MNKHNIIINETLSLVVLVNIYLLVTTKNTSHMPGLSEITNIIW